MYTVHIACPVLTAHAVQYTLYILKPYGTLQPIVPTGSNVYATYILRSKAQTAGATLVALLLYLGINMVWRNETRTHRKRCIKKACAQEP